MRLADVTPQLVMGLHHPRVNWETDEPTVGSSATACTAHQSSETVIRWSWHPSTPAVISQTAPSAKLSGACVPAAFAANGGVPFGAGGRRRRRDPVGPTPAAIGRGARAGGVSLRAGAGFVDLLSDDLLALLPLFLLNFVQLQVK